MFESDDFDHVLSQLDYSDSTSALTTRSKDNEVKPEGAVKLVNKTVKCNEVFRTCQKPLLLDNNEKSKPLSIQDHVANIPKDLNDYDSIEVYKDYEQDVQNTSGKCESAKANKRTILDSLFDHRSKRKFPGPAGLLTGSRVHTTDENLSRIEIFSQDIECSQEWLNPEVFDSELWRRMQTELQSWGALRIDSISCVTQGESAGRRPSRKAHTIMGFVEAIDRSAVDPMIVLRDASGTIKCTLHRDAWSAFSPYIISEYAAMALWKPTVLTTGTAFKKHYLTITLSNIIAIYGSKCIINSQDGTAKLPSGYTKMCVDDLTMIKKDSCPQLENDSSSPIIIVQENNLLPIKNEDHLEGLDSLSFLDDIF